MSFLMNSSLQKFQKISINQVYTSCLSQYSYIISSKRDSIIIDPLRENDFYINYLKNNYLNLKYILLTHFHADFVSGHIPLSKKTGAEICMFENSECNFDYKKLKNNEILEFDNNKIEVLHTPGHTLESVCYLLKENYENKLGDIALFSGDTIFMGDVGRPDLACNDNININDMAGYMFDSVQKVKKLNKDIKIFPGHGQGSPCGKNIQSSSFDTIENQKRTNYAFKIDNKNEFIRKITSNISKPPFYFKNDVYMNKSKNILSLEEQFNKVFKEFDLKKLENIIENNDISYNIIDSRSTNEFMNKYLKLSINSPLPIQYSINIGSLIKNEKIIIIGNKDAIKESVYRLLRIGYDNILGYICFENIKNNKLFETVNTIDKEEIKDIENLNFLDVRNKGELENGFLENSQNISISDLIYKKNELNLNDKIAIYCQGGIRSILAYSFLKKNGYKNIYNIKGGYNSLKNSI